MMKAWFFLALLAMLLPSGWVGAQAGTALRSDRTLARESGGETGSPGSAGFPSTRMVVNPSMNLLYPDDIDPPESCHVPRLAPLGQDIEMMLGPWGRGNPLLAPRPAVPPGILEQELDGVQASSNLAMVTLTTEDLVAGLADAPGK